MHADYIAVTPIAICAYCNGPIGQGEPIVAWQEASPSDPSFMIFCVAHRFRSTCEAVKADEDALLKEMGIRL